MACVWVLHELQCLFLYWNLPRLKNMATQDLTVSQSNYNCDPIHNERILSPNNTVGVDRMERREGGAREDNRVRSLLYTLHINTL